MKKLFICAFVRKCTVFFKKVCSVFLKKLFFCVFCSVLFFVCVLKKNYSFVRKLYCLKKGPYSVFLKIVDCDLCFFRESATFFGRKCTLFFLFVFVLTKMFDPSPPAVARVEPGQLYWQRPAAGPHLPGLSHPYSHPHPP